MKRLILIVLLLTAYPVSGQEIPASQQAHDFYWFADGAWLPAFDSLRIGPQNYRTLQNLRYTDTGLESVSGSSKVNTTALSTYPDIRNGIQLIVPNSSGETSFVVIHAKDSSSASPGVIYQNITDIPKQGDFESTALYTDTESGLTGYFSDAPNGNIAYANGKETCIWGGGANRIGAFITSGIEVTSTSGVSNSKDFTEEVANMLATADNVARIGGGNDSSCVLLLHADGADASTTVSDSSLGGGHGNAYVYEDAQLDTAIAKFGTSSLLTSGTSDCVGYEDDADWYFSSDKFAIDTWFRMASDAGLHGIVSQYDLTNSCDNFAWLYDADNDKFIVNVMGGATSYIQEEINHTLNAGQWYHLAMVRGYSGDTKYIGVSVDGTFVGTFDSSVTKFPDLAGPLLVSGVTEKTFIDYGHYRTGVTPYGDIHLSGTSGVYGSPGYIKFDGTNDYLSGASMPGLWDLCNTSGATYTLEMWAQFNTIAGDPTLIENRQDANNFWSLYLDNAAADVLYFYAYNAAAVNVTGCSTFGTSISFGSQWYHIAVVVGSGNLGIYVNGVNAGTGSVKTDSIIEGPLYIGEGFAHPGKDTEDMNGAIDEIRIYKGNPYNADPHDVTDTITVPTNRHTSDSNTTLLLYGDPAFANGHIDELRISKGTSRWSSDFTVPSEKYATANNYFLLGSTRPAQGGNFQVSSANATTATLTGKEWTGTGWSSLSLTDNTNGLANSGTITWASTVESSEPKFLEDRFLYWYQFHLSEGEADINFVTVDAPFQKLVDIWDGVYSDCIQFNVVRQSLGQQDYTLEINKDTSKEFPEAAQVGGLDSASEHILAMFENRQTAIYYSMIGGLENTASATTPTIYYWNGTGYTSVGDVTDGTADSSGVTTLHRTGVVSWAAPDKSEEYRQTIAGLNGYAYKITFASDLSGTTEGAVQIDRVLGIPAPINLKPFKKPVIFKNKLMLLNFEQNPSEQNRVDYCMSNAPDVWNGDDSSMDGEQSLFFGTNRPITSAVQLFNRFGSEIYSTLLLTKKTETYLLVGEGPEDYEIYPVSMNIGCPAPNTLTAVEAGYEIIQGVMRNIAIWLSYSGPMIFDGALLAPIKGIENYFDQSETECINYDYIEYATAWYDAKYYEWNLLIPSGTGQTTLNKWLVYDLVRKRWYEKVPATYPQSAWPVIDENGKRYVYTGQTNGYMQAQETSPAWDGTAIRQVVETGDYYPSKDPWHITLLRRLKLVHEKSTEAVTLNLYHYPDTTVMGSGVTNTLNSITLNTEIPTGSTNRVTRQTQAPNVEAWAHRFRMESSSSTEEKDVHLIGWGTQYEVIREDDTNQP